MIVAQWIKHVFFLDASPRHQFNARWRPHERCYVTLCYVLTVSHQALLQTHSKIERRQTDKERGEQYPDAIQFLIASAFKNRKTKWVEERPETWMKTRSNHGTNRSPSNEASLNCGTLLVITFASGPKNFSALTMSATDTWNMHNISLQKCYFQRLSAHIWTVWWKRCFREETPGKITIHE